MTTPTQHRTLTSLLDQFIRELDKSPLTIHLFFMYLAKEGVIRNSPTMMVKKPRKERKPKHVLRPDEYRRMLAAARGNPRDVAFLQLMLQTGLRVGELIAVREPDLDLEQKTLTILRKGSKKRILHLEKKALQAMQSYLSVRPKTSDQHLFLNYRGEGLSIGGVRKMVEKYVKRAGITKQISCRGLHYTCVTNRAALGMNAFQLRTPLRYERVRTSTKYMSMGIEELRKLMEFTSL